MKPIGLDDIEGVELMNRLDQKFLIHRNWIPSLLMQCREDYCMLEVSGQRISSYQNQFLETPEQKCFNDHTRGRKDRYKARIRRYGSTGVTFLEIKHKTVHGRTIKERLTREEGNAIGEPLTAIEQTFLQSHLPYSGVALTPMICEFERCTLVSKERGERVTIDSSIAFHHENQRADLGDLTVLEIKQERINRFSPIHNALKTFAGAPPPLARPTRMSKYIMGRLLLNPALKARLYKSTLRGIQRIQENMNLS